MGDIDWHWILINIFPTYILLVLILSMGGVLGSLIVPAFRVRKGLFVSALFLLMVMIFLGMVAMSIISVRFPVLYHL